MNEQNQVTDAIPAKVYTTKAECEASKPADAPKGLRPFEVSKAGTVVGWINGRGYDHCLASSPGSMAIPSARASSRHR